MYTSEQFNNWVLEGNPILSTKKPQVYHCISVKLINAATGDSITVPIENLSNMIPVAYGNKRQPIDQTALLAMTLDTINYQIPPIVEEPSIRNGYNGTGSHIKEHNHLSAAEVQEIEEFAKFSDFDVKQIMSTYNVSASVVSNIYRAKHAKTSPSFIEYRRTNPV